MQFETISVKVNDNTVNIQKPKLSRKITLTSRSNRGLLPSIKNKGVILHYESELEHDHYLKLDHDPHCVEIISQPRMGWKYNPYGSKTPVEIIPDTWARFLQAIVYIFEVKTEQELKELTKPYDPNKLDSSNLEERKVHRKRYNWQLKQQKIRENCKEFNYRYMILTERRIDTPRLRIIKNLLKDAKHWEIEKIRLFHSDFVMPKNIITNVREILNIDSNITIRELAAQLTSMYQNKYSFSTIIAILKNHIYHGQILIDWESKFDESNLLIPNRSNSILTILSPVYLEPESPSNKEYKKSGETIEFQTFDMSIIQSMIKELQHQGKLLSENYSKQEIEEKLSQFTQKELQPVIKKLSQKMTNKNMREITSEFSSWKKDFKQTKLDNLTKPIIDLFKSDDTISRQQIFDYCLSEGDYQEDGLGYSNTEAEKAYRNFIEWKKKYVYGKVKDETSEERKSKFDDWIEELLIEYTSKWNTEGGYMTSFYKKFENEVIQLSKSMLTDGNNSDNLDIPTYFTFRNYCQKIPKKARIGKYDSGVMQDIRRGNRSFYDEGRFPGSVIVIDHTQLDIWIVSYADKKAYVRPWVTLAIDVYSRAIWGIYISDQPPNQENNIKCILSGIVDKNEIFSEEWQYIQRYAAKNGRDLSDYQWRANGLPARIQVDNGKDFDSRLLKEFCTSLGITMEFRPVKTPEYGGYVESVWDTINDALRERANQFGGVVFSLPKRRQVVSRVNWKTPRDYNPKETAKTTFEMLKEWLLAYIVIEYNRDLHSRQSHSPNQFWTDGIIGKFPRPLGGELLKLSPKILSNLNSKRPRSENYHDIAKRYRYWEIISKPIHPSTSGKRIISHEGIQLDNFLYTSEEFLAARKTGYFNSKKFEDKQKVTVRYSREDVRYIWIKHPGGFMKLHVYKYLGDRAIWDMVEKGVRDQYPISKKNIDIMNTILEDRKDTDQLFSNSDYQLLASITEEYDRVGRLNQQQRKYLEKVFPGKSIPSIMLELNKNQNLGRQQQPEDEMKIVNDPVIAEELSSKINNEETVYLEDFDNIYEEDDEYAVTVQDLNANRLEE